VGLHIRVHDTQSVIQTALNVIRLLLVSRGCLWPTKRHFNHRLLVQVQGDRGYFLIMEGLVVTCSIKQRCSVGIVSPTHNYPNAYSTALRKESGFVIVSRNVRVAMKFFCFIGSDYGTWLCSCNKTHICTRKRLSTLHKVFFLWRMRPSQVTAVSLLRFVDQTPTRYDTSERVISSSQMRLLTQYTKITTDEHPCLCSDSNTRSQEPSGRRSTP
jgi:hypothetical protein